MSCRKAFEIDLVGFLAEPGAPAFAGFRDHYPRCRACSAELRAWTELELQLCSPVSEEGAGHPEAAALARYQEAPERLAALERARVERHLERCRSCRDELRALAQFSPQAVAGAAPPRRAAARQRVRDLLAPLGRLAWQPGFAYLLVGLLLLPAVYRSVGRWGPEPGPAATAEAVAPGAARPALPLAAAEESDRPRPSRRAMAKSEDEAPVAQLARMRSLAALEEEALREAPAAASPAPPVGRTLPVERTEPAEFSAFASGLVGAARGPLRLRSEATVEVPARDVAAGLLLLLPLPEDVREAGEAEIRVSDPTGRRQLRELRAVDPAAHAIEMNVPADWLAPGVFRVELRLERSGRGREEPVTYEFSVRQAPEQPALE